MECGTHLSIKQRKIVKYFIVLFGYNIAYLWRNLNFVTLLTSEAGHKRSETTFERFFFHQIFGISFGILLIFYEFYKKNKSFVCDKKTYTCRKQGLASLWPEHSKHFVNKVGVLEEIRD